MKIEWLEAFHKTVEAKSLTKASELLHISQPALSKQIRSLESDLGVKLLTRSTVGVTVTQAGQMVLDRSRTIINEVNSLRRELVRSQETGELNLTIGSWPSMATVYLPYHFANNKRLIHKSNFKIRVSYSFYELLKSLENGLIDAALFDDSEVKHPFYKKHVFEEDFMLFVNVNHQKYRDLEEVTFSQIKDETFVMLPEGCDVRALVEKEFSNRGEVLNIALEIELGQSILGFIEANLGIAILPEIFINTISNNVKAIPISDFKLKRNISVIAKEEEIANQIASLLKI